MLTQLNTTVRTLTAPPVSFTGGDDMPMSCKSASTRITYLLTYLHTYAWSAERMVISCARGVRPRPITPGSSTAPPAHLLNPSLAKAALGLMRIAVGSAELVSLAAYESSPLDGCVCVRGPGRQGRVTIEFLRLEVRQTEHESIMCSMLTSIHPIWREV